MDPQEKAHIRTNLATLLELITCNALLFAHLEESQTLGKIDVDILNSIPSQFEKTKKLLDFLESRVDGYNRLAYALEQTNQSGALAILRSFPHRNSGNAQSKENENPNAVETQSKVTKQMSHSNYRVEFDREIGDVLTTLTPRLVSTMGNKSVNLQIILQLESLLLFEHDEIQGILTADHYRSEKQRIADLIEAIRNTGDDGIRTCLEKLCDLEGLPRYSERLRGIILEKFPGSVNPR